MAALNWRNRTLWTGDNLDIMRGMNSDSVDLIYLDPPFNSNRNYSAPIGSEAAGAAFKDTWHLSDVDEAWHGEIADREPTLYAIIDAAGYSHGKGMKSYLIMMAVRLIEIRRLMKATGSIYLHCDPTASHYLKMLMDAVLGQKNFLNEIIWCYNTGGRSTISFPKKHDVILRYGLTSAAVFYYKNVALPRDFTTMHETVLTDTDGRKYQRNIKAGKEYRYYFDKGVLPNDWWADIQALNPAAKERLGYPTQKPLSLLHRIIKASSNKGDVVFDPFCGCATACVAAEQLQRNWVGIDLSPLAAKLVNSRLQKDMGLFFDIHHREDVPKRTDLGDLPNYRTHKHMLYGRQEGVCGGCQVMFPFRNITVDHIVAQSKGGSDHMDNLQLLCGACNSTKGARSQEEFIVRLTEQGLRS